MSHRPYLKNLVNLLLNAADVGLDHSCNILLKLNAVNLDFFKGGKGIGFSTVPYVEI